MEQPMKPKRKIRRAYKIAFALAAGVLGLHLGIEAVTARLADETPAVLAQTGLTRKDIAGMTGGAVVIMRPGSDNAQAFARATLDRAEMAIKKSVKNETGPDRPFTTYGAEAFRDSIFSPARPADRLSFGLTG